MDELTEKTSQPQEILIPDDVFSKVQRELKAAKPRGFVFENQKQRNTQYIKKGISKPGRVSFEVLRRASVSVHVARICINVLKEKVTKTPWVIKSKDPKKKVDEKQIKVLEDLFRHPNKNSETFRTLLDKMLEDLLVLDTVSLEKTRYPNGELAELHFVDSATIRPVFDQFGNQDVEIPLEIRDPKNQVVIDQGTEPISYVQVVENSQYGGPESGIIVAAWPKKDFLRFHMHPQGAFMGVGYGLSPLEGVLSVVANLLNADNFNGTYFEEGAFPPVILHIAGQVDQRNLEAYKEYLYSELQGNFHRPAIMAGGTEMTVHNLKDLSNRDMQFMEYTMFLAKLMAAAYGLSPQDIGLTDDVNRSTSETMKGLSNQKGYTSILHLIKEVLNQEIIWKDYGFEDLEFDWALEDSVDPKDASDIYDKALRNGTMTMNEVRQKLGLEEYERSWDKPMILGMTGYMSMLSEDNEQNDEEDDEESGGNKPFGNKPKPKGTKTDDKKKSIKKSLDRPLFVCRYVKNADDIIAWAKSQGFEKCLTPDKMHVTIAHSSNPMNWESLVDDTPEIGVYGGARTVKTLGEKGAVVLTFESPELTGRWSNLVSMGASWDYPEYIPHVTITYGGEGIDPTSILPYEGPIYLGEEVKSELNEQWLDTVSEKSVMNKSVMTPDGYRVWMDDRGYSQPFICQNILGGDGYVIKPPVAVNITSQRLEEEITNDLANRGFNVSPVRRMTYIDVFASLVSPNIQTEFISYINLDAQYDSEKWRAKFGGSRKYPYYLYSKYIDGLSLTNPLLIADMKRDPTSYVSAINDLARLWLVEKEQVLGDRRADQYIITPTKRAWGFDYQFKGDEGRWVDSADSIETALRPVPELHTMFMEKIGKIEQPSILKSLWRKVKPKNL